MSVPSFLLCCPWNKEAVWYLTPGFFQWFINCVRIACCECWEALGYCDSWYWLWQFVDSTALSDSGSYFVFLLYIPWAIDHSVFFKKGPIVQHSGWYERTSVAYCATNSKIVQAPYGTNRQMSIALGKKPMNSFHGEWAVQMIDMGKLVWGCNL